MGMGVFMIVAVTIIIINRRGSARRVQASTPGENYFSDLNVAVTSSLLTNLVTSSTKLINRSSIGEGVFSALALSGTINTLSSLAII